MQNFIDGQVIDLDVKNLQCGRLALTRFTSPQRNELTPVPKQGGKLYLSSVRLALDLGLFLRRGLKNQCASVDG